MKTTWSMLGWIGCAVLIAVLAFEIFATAAHSPRAAVWSPSVWGLLVLILAWCFSSAITGTWNPLAIGLGEDRRLSLSKTQTLFWTYVVLYAFTAIYVKDAALYAAGTSPLIPITFPDTVLLLLGFSVTTQIAAAGITRTQLANRAITKSPRTDADYSLKWLVLDDDQQVDLTRFQVVVWTVVAAGAFLNGTQASLAATGAVTGLPDIGNALVLLMGIGQAAYVGGKLVITPKPVIYRIVPNHGTGGATTTIDGGGFGTAQGTSDVLFGGASATITSWSDTSIAFTVPATQADGTAWPAASSTVDVVVSVGTAQSQPAPFTIP